MAKFPTILSFYALVLASFFITLEAKNVALDFFDNLEKLRNTLECITHSCNPIAALEFFKVEDVAEMSIQQGVKFPETRSIKVMKLDQAVVNAIPKLLAIEPKCNDSGYKCPYPVKDIVPVELNEYIELLDVILSSKHCLGPTNLDVALDILNTATDYIEYHTDHTVNPIGRVLPAVAIVAKGLNALCS